MNALEAESIEIIREAVATGCNPVMLYSIGKDSSVMLHLARKAFYPGRNNRGQTTVYLGFDPSPSASEQLRHPENNRGQTTVYLGFDPCPSASEQLRHP